MTLTPDTKPKLSRGCRLHEHEAMLLVPEGALKLVGPARDILALVDGERTFSEIVESLASRYAAEPELIRGEAARLLERLQERGAVRW